MQFSATDVISLRMVGALAGVVPLCAGGLNGTGTGRLISSLDGGGNAQLAWQAPDSATPGTPQPVAPDGSYLMEDGDDPTKFIRVTVYGNYLPAAGEARVYLDDRYNEFGPSDVTAAQATAGQIITTTYTLANVSPTTVYNVKAWLPVFGFSPGITISLDNVSFFHPTSETDPNVLTWASIAPGASVPVYVKRTIAALTTYNPDILNILFFAWTGL